jgi:hypothetical protein
MFKITDNNGATLVKGSEKKCMAFVKKQLDFQYVPMTIEKFDGQDWYSIRRVA